MRSYSVGKGVRKAVEKFTKRQGLWMLAILLLMGILMLCMLHRFPIDAD
jgi:hypothetical protein